LKPEPAKSSLNLQGFARFARFAVSKSLICAEPFGPIPK
jgi:hypothetical protein